jgi:hypothetical protein
MHVLRAARIFLLPALVACFAAFGSSVALGDQTDSGSAPDVPAADTRADTTTATPPQELTPDPAQPPGADYGASTAIGGSTVLVGSPNDQGRGSVTVFNVGADGTATQTGTLTPSAPAEYFYGTSVATDGNTIAIGAPGDPVNEGVDIYDAATLALLQQLFGPDEVQGFGDAVALSGDWLAVGAPGSGSSVGVVLIYHRQDGTWGTDPYQWLSQENSNSGFGSSLAMDGTTLVIGAPGDAVPIGDGYSIAGGAAYLYTLIDGDGGLTWSLTGDPLYDPNPVDGGGFGSAVAISGTTVAVGAPSPGIEGDPGRVLVYVDPLGEGASGPQTIAGGAGDSLFGQSLGLSGSNLAIGYVQPDSSGAVALYGPAIQTSAGGSGGGFSLLGNQTGTGPGDGFGQSLGGSGQNFVIGGDGHAYLVSANGTTPPDPGPGPGPGPVFTPTTGGASGPASPGSGGKAGVSSSGSGEGASSSSPGQLVQPKPIPPASPGIPEGRGHDAAAAAAAPAAEQATPPGRSSFANRVLTPGQVDLSAKNLAEGGMLAFILATLLYLPVMIFNKTTERNHETISGWFAGPGHRLAALATALPLTAHPLALLLASGVIGGALFAFVEPGFPSEEGSLQYLVGMMLGFTLVGLAFFATWRETVKRLEPDSQGRWRLYSPYILLAAVLVIISRLAHFLPGVVLGTLAEYEPGKHLSRRTAGLRVLITYSVLLALGGAAWFAWIPVEHAAAKEGASSLTLIGDAALAVTFVTGLESVVFGLIPLKFLDGNDLYVWHKGAWLALWGVGLYWFSVVILHPALSTYNEVSGAGAFWFGILFGSLMIVAMSTWGYFRAREARLARVASD